MPRSTFKQPKQVSIKEPDPIYKSRMQKTIEAYQQAHFSYQPDSFTERHRDMKEQMNLNLQAEYPDLIKETLVSIHRVLLSPGQFQFADGKLDEKGKVKSALVYKVTVEILSEQAKKLGYDKVASAEYNAAQHTFEIGRFARPIVEPLSFDRQGHMTDAKIKETRFTYWIPDDQKTIQSIIKRYGQPTKKPVVCDAAIAGDSPYKNSYSLVNEKDFWEGHNVKDIIEGNRVNMPVDAYKVWERKKQDLLAGGQATETQLAKLSSKTIVDMIASIETAESKK